MQTNMRNMFSVPSQINEITKTVSSLTLAKKYLFIPTFQHLYKCHPQVMEKGKKH